MAGRAPKWNMGLSLALLFGAPGLVRFAIAAVLFKFAWTFILPYLLSTLAGLGNAHAMSVVNLMIGTGFAIGPLLSGALIESTGNFTAMLSIALRASLSLWQLSPLSNAKPFDGALVGRSTQSAIAPG